MLYVGDVAIKSKRRSTAPLINIAWSLLYLRFPKPLFGLCFMMIKARKERISELDGLRGWAALSIVIFHIFWESLGVRFPVFRNIFTAWLMNGQLAVCVFFTVSGAALSARFFQDHDQRAVLSAAVKRYPRLTLPILVASLITVATSNLGVLRGSEAAYLLGRSDWLGLNNQADISLLSALKFSFVDVYIGPSSGGNILPFLWTMSIEIGGSIALFLYLLVHDSIERPLRFLFILYIATLIISPFFACFFAGICIASIRARGSFWKFVNRRPVAPISILLALSLSSVLVFYAVPGSQYFNALLAVGLCFVSVNNELIGLFLSKNEISIFLGNISFPIYLMQYLALNTLMAWCVIYYGNLDVASAFLIGMVTLAFAIFLAIVFLPVDRMSHWVSGWIARSALKVRR